MKHIFLKKFIQLELEPLNSQRSLIHEEQMETQTVTYTQQFVLHAPPLATNTDICFWVQILHHFAYALLILCH